MLMRYISFFAAVMVIITFLAISVSGDEKRIYGSISVDNLTVTSYSPDWDNTKVKQLYDELQNNFTANEYPLLSAIYIYPDSPSGYNGEYFEDITVEDGSYKIGNGAYINLYNGSRYNTVEKIAPILSHEYGHHYTLVNILRSEGRYYNNWINSNYGKIRNLSEFDDICFSKSQDNYSYRWDVREIAANDYYELLGSPTGKSSLDYPDTEEQLKINSILRSNPKLEDKYDFSHTAYNAMPQKNLDIPLAADTDGLYEYFLQLGGYTGQQQSLNKYPKIFDISYSDSDCGREYTIKWTEALGQAPFEYTLIMYGKNSSVIPIPIKTVSSGEELCAKFGSGTDGNDTIQKEYNGEYEFVIFTEDANGFMYSTTPVSYDFSTAESVTTYIQYPLQDGTLHDVFNAVIKILEKEERQLLTEGGYKK
jgi:hypothetical protein